MFCFRFSSLDLAHSLTAHAENQRDLVERARSLTCDVQGAIAGGPKMMIPVTAVREVTAALGVRAASVGGAVVSAIGDRGVTRWSNGVVRRSWRRNGQVPQGAGHLALPRNSAKSAIAASEATSS